MARGTRSYHARKAMPEARTTTAKAQPSLSRGVYRVAAASGPQGRPFHLGHSVVHAAAGHRAAASDAYVSRPGASPFRAPADGVHAYDRRARSAKRAHHSLVLIAAGEGLSIGKPAGPKPTGLKTRHNVVSNISDNPAERSAFWQFAARYERANGIVQRRFNYHLPAELSVAGKMAVVRRVSQRAFGDHGLPFVSALHAPEHGNDPRNWHAHTLVYDRPCRLLDEALWDFMTDEKQNKDRRFHDRAWWRAFRETIAEEVNREAAQERLPVRYCALTYEAMGIAKRPATRLRPKPHRLALQGQLTAQARANMRAQRQYEKSMEHAAIARRANVLEQERERQIAEARKVLDAMVIPQDRPTLKPLEAARADAVRFLDLAPRQLADTEASARFPDRSRSWLTESSTARCQAIDAELKRAFKLADADTPLSPETMHSLTRIREKWLSSTDNLRTNLIRGGGPPPTTTSSAMVDGMAATYKAAPAIKKHVARALDQAVAELRILEQATLRFGRPNETVVEDRVVQLRRKAESYNAMLARATAVAKATLPKGLAFVLAFPPDPATKHLEAYNPHVDDYVELPTNLMGAVVTGEPVQWKHTKEYFPGGSQSVVTVLGECDVASLGLTEDDVSILMDRGSDHLIDARRATPESTPAPTSRYWAPEHLFEPAPKPYAVTDRSAEWEYPTNKVGRDLTGNLGADTPPLSTAESRRDVGTAAADKTHALPGAAVRTHDVDQSPSHPASREQMSWAALVEAIALSGTRIIASGFAYRADDLPSELQAELPADEMESASILSEARELQIQIAHRVLASAALNGERLIIHDAKNHVVEVPRSAVTIGTNSRIVLAVAPFVWDIIRELGEDRSPSMEMGM